MWQGFARECSKVGALQRMMADMATITHRCPSGWLSKLRPIRCIMSTLGSFQAGFPGFCPLLWPVHREAMGTPGGERGAPGRVHDI